MKKLASILAVFLTAAAFVASFVSCGDDPGKTEKAKVTGITVYYQVGTKKEAKVPTNGKITVAKGDEVQFRADVAVDGGDASKYQDVIWELDGEEGDTEIDDFGLLTIDADEDSSELTVTILSVKDTSFEGKEVTVIISGGTDPSNPTGTPHALTVTVTGGNLTSITPAGGAAITSGGTVASGTQVTIVAAPTTATHIAGITATPALTPALTGASPWTFTMPAHALDIAIAYSATGTPPVGPVGPGDPDQTRSLTVNVVPAGSATVAIAANAATVVSGGQVKVGINVDLTVTKAATATFASIAYTPATPAITGLAGPGSPAGTWAFEMPDRNLTITVTYTTDSGQNPPPGGTEFDGIINFAGLKTDWLADGEPYGSPWNSAAIFWQAPAGTAVMYGVADAPAGSTTPSLRLVSGNNGQGWGNWFGWSDVFEAPYVDLTQFTSVDIAIKKANANAEFWIVFADDQSTSQAAREIRANANTTAANTWQTVTIQMSAFQVNGTGGGCDRTKIRSLAWGTGQNSIGDVIVNSITFH